MSVAAGYSFTLCAVFLYFHAFFVNANASFVSFNFAFEQVVVFIALFAFFAKCVCLTINCVTNKPVRLRRATSILVFV